MLSERFTRSRRWILHSSIAILASAGLVAALAPAGAAASPRPAGPTTAAAQPYYSVAQNYTIRFYSRFMTYFQQSIGQFNRLVGPNRISPLGVRFPDVTGISR